MTTRRRAFHCLLSLPSTPDADTPSPSRRRAADTAPPASDTPLATFTFWERPRWPRRRHATPERRLRYYAPADFFFLCWLSLLLFLPPVRRAVPYAPQPCASAAAHSSRRLFLFSPTPALCQRWRVARGSRQRESRAGSGACVVVMEGYHSFAARNHFFSFLLPPLPFEDAGAASPFSNSYTVVGQRRDILAAADSFLLSSQELS